MVRKLVARILGGGRDAAPAEPARASSAMLPRNPASEFAAVSITPGSPCCSAVAGLRGQRMLQASAPRLPLADCSRPQDCNCRFQKHADRRGEDDDRRIAGLLQMSSWYAGSERRNKRGRRSGDA